MVLAFESNCKLDKHLGGRVSRLTDDFGAEFAAHSDSLPYRTIGIYVFLRHRLCSPVRSQIAHALKLSRYERRLDRTLLGAVGAHVLGAVSGSWHGRSWSLLIALLSGLPSFNLWHFGEAARSDAQIESCSRRCMEQAWLDRFKELPNEIPIEVPYEYDRKALWSAPRHVPAGLCPRAEHATRWTGCRRADPVGLV